MIKKIIGQVIRSRTMWLAAILSALGVLQASTEALTPYLGAKSVGLLTLIVGVLVAILRVVTVQPLSDK